KPPPERRDRVVVRMVVGRYEAERHRVIGRPFQLPARKHPRRIAINQNAEQHSGMIGCRARAAITAAHRPKVKPIDHLHNEARQMLLRKPFVHGGRQQKPSLPINRTEVAHQKAALVRLSPSRPRRVRPPQFSDAAADHPHAPKTTAMPVLMLPPPRCWVPTGS